MRWREGSRGREVEAAAADSASAVSSTAGAADLVGRRRGEVSVEESDSSSGEDASPGFHRIVLHLTSLRSWVSRAASLVVYPVELFSEGTVWQRALSKCHRILIHESGAPALASPCQVPPILLLN